MTHTVKRKLTTIFCADVVGYSKLMGVDEQGTLRRLKECRELIEAFITRHRGRVVSWSGDAVLADFNSVVESVQCAVEIQRELKAQNEALDAAQRMAFRIGVNLGDVMIDDHDIFGEGVNIAARLQSIAPPGGILISGSVHDQIRNKLALGYNFMGNQQVKNIADQVPAFVVLHDTAPSMPIAGEGTQRKAGRAVALAPAPVALRIAAGAVDAVFAGMVAIALTIGLQGAAGPVFAVDAPFTFFATERQVSSDLPSTDIEGGGKIIRTTTRSIVERNFLGLAKQTVRRTDVELGSTQASKRPTASSSTEELIDLATGNTLVRLPLTLATVMMYFVLQVLAEGLLMPGATPGKILMGIRVSPVQDARMDLNRAAMRNVLKIVSVATLLAGVLMAFMSKRRQMLHDLLSGSYVHDAK